MRSFVIFTAGVLLLASCSASYHGAVSTQYQQLGHDHTYAYGYADPNSQKHESRSHDGVTRGSYSYVDGHGHVQSVSYVADPHHGFNAVGTNLPKGPAPAPYAAAHAYVPYHHAAIAHHIPIITHAGVPLDTPEVQHARAAHLAAHAAAAHGHGGHHLYKRSLYGNPWAHAPVTLHGGVPVDTPEVQHAKAAHFAAHAAAAHGAHGGHGSALHHAAGPQHIPIIHNGVPVDTPEVQHAKAAHYAALAEASAHSGGHGGDHYDDGHYDGRWDGPADHYDGHSGHHGAATHFSTHATHDGGHYGGGYGGGYGYKGPIHIPVIHNGVPVEPAEVQHARAAHLNALAAASHGAGYGHHGKW